MSSPTFPLPTAAAHQWVLYLTARCNFSCDYCIQKGLIVPGAKRRPWARYDELSGKDWVRSLNSLPERPEHTLILTGGEPTIHRDFYEIATGLEGYRLDLTSNLSFDIDEFIRKLRDAGKRLYSSFHTYHPKFMAPEAFVERAVKLRDSGVIENPVFSLLNLDRFPHFRDEEHDRNLDVFNDFADKRGLGFQRNEFRGNHMGEAFQHEARFEMGCTSGWVNVAPNGDIHNCQYHLETGQHCFGNITKIEDCKEIPAYGSFFRCTDFGYCDSCHENSGRGAFMDAEGKIFRRTNDDARVYLKWMDAADIGKLARKYLDGGELEEAQHAFLAAIGKEREQGGEDPDTWRDLALTLWTAGQKESALAAFLHVLELGAHNAENYAAVLELARETGREAEAKQRLSGWLEPQQLKTLETVVAKSFV